MGSIIVETAQGPVQVDIAGDTPTEEEQQAIISQFSGPQPTQSEIDFATASLDEIRDYARAKRMAGIDPKTGEQITEEEYVSKYKEPGVDYTSGVDSIGGFSRFQFGRMDTADEKSNYLRTVVGSDGYRVDPLGRHILTQEGRTKLGLGEGRELAIDEEGFSFNDVKEFAGATALPIATGIGASLVASGVGFLPGVLIVGGATAAGKLLDEGIEAAEGLQMQSAGEIARDVAMEGVFGGLGEGVGRGISKLFGRIIKGPGGEANEALRAQARDVINRGYRPTVAGATSEEFRPILNRLQAVYEGVFPNQKAAMQNLQQVVADLRAAGIADDSAINNLDEIVKKDITDFFASGDETLAQAQRRMDDAVRNEIDQVMRNLKDGKSIPKNLQDMIRQRKAVFDEDVDRLYTMATNALRGKKIISTKGIKEELARLETDSIADIASTGFAAKVRALGEFATPQEIGRLRKGLTDATYNPSIMNDVNVGALGSLKASINDAFTQAEINLGLMQNPALIPADATVTLPKGFTLGDISAEQGKEALGLLRRTNLLYRTGIKRFDNVVVQDIVKQAQNGQMNMKFIFDKIVQEDNPEALDQLLKAIRGAPTNKALGAEAGIADLDAGARILKQQQIGGRSVEQALKDVEGLAPNDPTRRFVEGEAARLEREAFERAKIRGKGSEMADQVRQGLAKMYLEKQLRASRTIDPATGEAVIDPIELVANLRQKGTTVDKLFGDDMKALDDVISVLERGKANLSPGVAEALRSKPLGQALKDFQAAQTARSALNRDRLINTLQQTDDPEVIAQTVFNSPSSIRQAQKFLSPERMNQVKDAAMGRILKQIGATVDEAGEIRMTDDFIESFKSGRLGNKLQSVLRSYGDDTLNAMFGPNGAEGLTAMAETMVKASNASIKGKGGLAAPNIALGLGLFQLMGNLTTALPTAVMYAGMSKALRNPKVLRMMMASRKPNSVKEFMSGKFKANDPIAQGFQAFWQIMSAATVQGGRMATEQATEEARPATQLAMQELQPQIQQTISQIPQVQPAQAGTTAQVSPILNPNPATQALAQALGRTNP